MEHFLAVKDLKKTYHPPHQAPVEALRGVTLSVEPGELIAITGVSGSGKSTLLHIVGLLDNQTEGTLTLGTADPAKLSDSKRAKLRNKEIGFVLQDFALVPYWTAYRNVEVPLIFAKMKRKNRKARIEQLLLEFGISELAKRHVSQMSGGQRQRVAIARALANDPPLLLADEPTGALDSKTKEEIMDIFRALHRRGKTILIVTHDSEIAAMADRILQIRDGVIVDA